MKLKKHGLLIAIFFSAFTMMADEKISIDGINYTLHGNGTKGKISVKVKDKKLLPSHLEIPASIIINNREYPVSEIEKNAFAGCNNLVSVILPNTIDKIGVFAFKDCSSLKQAILPDEAKASIYKGDYGFNGGGIFKGCIALEDVRGINIPYPTYILYDAIWECPEVPFFQTVEKNGAVTMARTTKSISFLEYVLAKVKEPIEQWQKRKEYETIAQWETRVTDTNRSKMIKEYAVEAKNSFIKENAPKTLTGVLDPYNETYQFFPVSTPNMGTLYVLVPPEDKEAFKNNWTKVNINPIYGILDGEIAVLDCTFTLDNKVFKSPQKYDEDELSQYATNITPLASLREYEQMMAASQTSFVNNNNSKKYDPDIIDIEIPDNPNVNDKTFVVIIGNEDYQRVAPVEFAMNDARILEKYCYRTLGIPMNNIRTYYNASYGDIVAAMEDLKNISDAFKGDINVLFYYAGHGVPDESNRNAYILPIDATGTQKEVCYPLEKLYEQLGELNVNSVVAFFDACFSGSLRGEGMLESARGIKLRPKELNATGNLIVMSAASADQTALPYREKNHGLFTYYLLKKLNESKGDIQIGELADYLAEEVAKTAIVENKKPQSPNIKWSTNLSDKWRNIPLK